MTGTEQYLAAALDRAQDAFWREIARAFPLVTSGDLEPAAVGRFEAAANLAVERWLIANAP